MGEMPSGTLTMLFSDIEGSTRLLARLGDRYADALSEQRRIMRAAFARWAGHEVGTEGDSFFAVFESARDAVQACRQAQRELARHEWPHAATLRVRMGLHTGEATRHEDNYLGMDVHLAARIAATAHGGQTILSEATAESLAAADQRTADRPAFDLLDLGWHRLKDIAEPTHLFQLLVPGLDDQFPPLKSLGNRTNLPVPPTPIVGRDKELRELAELLADPATRLVTLTGPGGAGKSRLATELAAEVDETFKDGVYFVPLASVTSADVMWTTIAEVLGVTGDGRSPPTFFEHIGHRQSLYVLDNLEQLPDAPAVVAGLLAAAPSTKVVATSRGPLHVLGEHEHPVAALSVPTDERLSRADVERFGAVELFVQNARMVRPGFAITDDNAADVAAICRRLDGLPLAIELAAARLRLLGPRALLARLDQTLELGSRDVGRPDRQRTLRDAIAWSYDLLSPQMQAFFRRLGVFAGGCDLAAVSAVTGRSEVLEVVAELADASLVAVRDGSDGEPRVDLLQTVRAYALERLDQDGELDASRRAHAEHYLAFAEEVAPELQKADPIQARDRLETELENLRGALTWSLRPDLLASERPPADGIGLGLKLCQALSWFWYSCGYTAEGHRWQDRAVALSAGEDGPDLANALHGLALLQLQQGEIGKAREALSTALAIWRRLGNRSKIAMELNSLGVSHLNAGENDEARRLLGESIAAARDIGAENRESVALTNLGTLEVDEGNAGPAIQAFARAAEIDRKLGNTWGLAIISTNLVGALLLAGRVEEARASLHENAADTVGLGDVELNIDILELYAGVFAALGDVERSARMVGTAEAMRDQAGMPRHVHDADMLERFVGQARAELDPDTWERQAAAGRGLSVDEALLDARRG